MLEQKGCRYIPHVFGVQAGQTIQVANNDTTLHNVHALPKNNREFNFGQPANVPAVPRVFDRPEIGTAISLRRARLDERVHQRGSAHPFFAVSERRRPAWDEKGLPPGTYTIEVVARTVGHAVTVGDGGRQDAGRR